MIVETPVTVVSHQTQVTGTMPAGTPVLIAKGAPTAAPSAEGTTGAPSAGGNTTTALNQLPKTVSNVPLLGIVGLLSLSVALGSRLLRRIQR
jgi:hypothetical protein